MTENHDLLVDCNLYGCIYNDDGACGYRRADLQIPYMRACGYGPEGDCE